MFGNTRNLKNSLGLLALSLILAVGLVVSSNGRSLAQATGGALVFGQQATPPTLDQHFASSISTRNIAMHMFETILTRNEANEVVPDLAQSYEVSDDGLRFTFQLREGVLFHNGKEMTSADVLASFERYKRIGLRKGTLDPVAAMSAPDKYTFVIELKQPRPVFLDELSAFVTPIAIIPEEETHKEGGKIELIGTGPYKFVEWIADSHVTLERFEDYSQNLNYEGKDGFAGRKVAYLDRITFKFVSESGARVAGLETGELHAVEDVPFKSAERLEANPEIEILPMRRWWIHGAYFNFAKPPTDNLLVRRAIQIALDMDEVMLAATDGAYDLQPGFQYPGNPYYVTTGQDYYNRKDPAGAKELLEEAGYNGEELVIVSNTSYPSMYNASIIVSERLKELGLNVSLEVFDWAGAKAKRQDRDGWNLWFSGSGTPPSIGPFTAMELLVGETPISFEPDPVLNQVYAEMVNGESFEERKEAFGRFQERIYENAVYLKFGDLTKLQAGRSDVKGFVPYRIPRLWGVWLEN